jgi:hypothetical protein
MADISIRSLLHSPEVAIWRARDAASSAPVTLVNDDEGVIAGVVAGVVGDLRLVPGRDR